METITYHLAVIGASSTIASQYIRERAIYVHSLNKRAKISLCVRNIASCGDILQFLNARSIEYTVYEGDLSEVNPTTLNDLFNEDVDEFMMAYASLTEQLRGQDDRDYLKSELNNNILSQAIWLEEIVAKLESQLFGRLVILGSIAGDRGRQSNYIYGAAKGAMEVYFDGLQHRLAKYAGVNLTLIKMGYVSTKMTSHLENTGPLWSSPSLVAKAILKAVNNGKAKVYIPWYWYGIATVLKCLPRKIMHRTKL